MGWSGNVKYCARRSHPCEAAEMAVVQAYYTTVQAYCSTVQAYLATVQVYLQQHNSCQEECSDPR